MMTGKELQILTKPVLVSNKRLEEDFTAEIFRRVERTSRSKAPQFLFFRPQSRPKEEFDENIAPLFQEELSSQDTIFVSISNNTQKSDDYLDDTGFTFKLKVKFLLTEGRLDIDRNEEELLKLTDMLIEAYQFRKSEGEDAKNEEQDTEMTEQSEEIRSLLKNIEELVTLLILNDFRSEYTTSLLSALEGKVLPYLGIMQATQFHAYKWNNIQIIDPGFSEDIDLVEAFLDQVSKNGKLGIIVVLPKGSEIYFEDKKTQFTSTSTIEGASWHMVVTTETVKEIDTPQAKQELERVCAETKLSKNAMHLVKNYTDGQTESCLNLVQLTVLKDIVDCVIKYTVPRKARRTWLVYLLYITSTVVLVFGTTYAMCTTCMKSVWKIPRVVFNKSYYLFQRWYHNVRTDA